MLLIFSAYCSIAIYYVSNWANSGVRVGEREREKQSENWENRRGRGKQRFKRKGVAWTWGVCYYLFGGWGRGIV